MRYAIIYSDGNKIEILNSCFGKETIKVNDKIVSEKRSLTGGEHEFSIEKDGNKVPYRLELGFNLNGAGFNLYKEEEPIIEMLDSEKRKKGLFIYALIVFVTTFVIITLDKLL